MEIPYVSIVVPTKNSVRTLGSCLSSIISQSYPSIECIVIDNYSTDGTQTLARQYTHNVFSYGPERNTQRNEGARRAKGEFLLFIDSDMTLDPDVVKECVAFFYHSSDFTNSKTGSVTQNIRQPYGIIIPEESFGSGFWAECKTFERSFYEGVSSVEAARFFPTSVFEKIEGYNESLIAGEDWDLSDRAEETGPIKRIFAHIHHDEGTISLSKTLYKKYYYAKQAYAYMKQDRPATSKKRFTGGFFRFFIFFKQPKKLLRQPKIALGMLVMKLLEYAAGAMGFVVGFIKESNSSMQTKQN